MEIKFQNTLTRKKELFKPLSPPKVTMYACGVTAYDESHLGHARAAVVFDVLFRFLRYVGFEVVYVRNYTDIDDKIIKRAHEVGVSPKELAERYIKSYDEDMRALKVLKPTYEPRATEHIPQIIALIERLIEKGFAYVVDGDVYFSVEKFPEYGKLSGRNLEELKAGARIAVSDKKRHPLDFALWKVEKPGEPSWESPWGRGRPGWHIECSAMAMHYLGETIDIHGGGLDLIFPHHENEIAQSEAATGKPFVRYWLHNGMVTVGREKMSKSLGNFVTIKQMLSRHHPEALRLFLLSMHYRSPLDYTEKVVGDHEKALEGFYETLFLIEKLEATEEKAPEGQKKNLAKIQELVENFENNFLSALADDLNTAKAIAALFTLEKGLNNLLKLCARKASRDHVILAQKGKSLAVKLAGELLGILEESPESFIENKRAKGLSNRALNRDEVEKLIKEREEARKAKDFEKADAIRDDLAKKGIILRDTPWGTFWKVEYEPSS
ncbi:cysteine--tRNA ligase [Thermodesulfatator autotrophicus]|uniref:Cysteine--tRNA ligase n=1 Tax=Thermodesulfatator autotrophicus TaxID=1795632 RepID=A0A177E3Z2_9BACT|nr:cysteine--tRNA ligase [Thermodesulfatator autotrophicus]